MEAERLYEVEKGFTLYRATDLTDEILHFLENTAFGTHTNLYRHYYIREFVAATPQIEFYYLRDSDDDLVAMGAFCKRTFLGPPSFEGVYIRYFAASPKIRGKKMVKRFSKIFIENVREKQKGSIVFFGTIEGRNKASKSIADYLGFEEFAPLQTMGFSRFFPKMKGDVQQVSDEEWKELLPKLDARYADYAFWAHDYLNLNNEYYVLKKDGKVVCGAQAHHAHWVVEAMSGFIGKYVLPILPYVPFIRNIFNPKAFHFISLEGFFVEPGHEADMVDLFESILYLKKRNSILAFFDERDPLYQFMIKQNKLGLFARFTGDAKTTFIADFSCFDEKQAEALRAKKICYATGYDYI